ncbi:hypothetical protein H072_8960 [Dactylellina haptotyla CBS 200.50]|uniref:Mur ligase central domain-containing protein n=1 Tax=Dactylellina haptotyla (strain CBS 200.50) TaxID=1284197 RepID=S8A8E4_DACHA|nr:hypothetical protein H072_8960 [Dactylellina haptotyla CBS 200.50]
MAAEFYDHPSRKLLLVGITGTNGKTTTAALIAQVLRRQGLSSVGVIGTLGATTEKTYFDTGCTTPRSLDTQRLLAEFVDNGAEAVVIEVSSHGLGLQRCVGCAFDFAVFTNFSQDHLDFHGSMKEYWDTKMLFFTELARYSLQYKPFTAIVNIDDEKGKELVGQVVSGYPYVTYGIESEADVKGGDVELAPASVRFTVESEGSRGLFDVALTGRFNVYNSLAAISCGLQRKIPMAEIQQAMNTVKAPAGRMEFINEGQEFGVVVDYAHSSGALEKILPAIREFNAGKGRLICVFGCGGDRDHSKRSQMGAVAAELADVVVITSDNPRSEDPEKIVRDIRNGIASGADTEVVVEVDRRKAIEYAVGIARDGDFIVLAGKGHETYQVLKDTIINFDDREVAREALRTRKSKG